MDPTHVHSGVTAASPGPHDSDPVLVSLAHFSAGLRRNDEQHLMRAFRSFSEAAASLESSYAGLQVEVKRLRRELEASRAGLESSLEENRRMRAQLDRILESLPCGVLVTAKSGAITHLNPAAARLLALAGQHPGAPCAIENVPAAERELLERARESGSEVEAGVRDSEGRWLAVRHAVMDDGDPEERSSVFILQDVSGRKRLEQAEQELRREQALAEMSAVLAHEIRNPLGSLELFAGLLAESASDRASRKWIGHIQAGLRTLAATVNNVLHFHSLPEPACAPLDLGSLLDWAQGFCAPLAYQAQIRLACEHSLAGVEIAADRHRLEQVLLNLVLNAIRATPEGGSIQIGGGRTRDGIFVTVADTGPGIPPGSRDRIFGPGFSTRPGGPGLGLAVCRKIVEQHGGAIKAESCPGNGATFIVELPDRRESATGARR